MAQVPIFLFKEWSNYLMQMIQLGAMEIAYNEGHVLRLTDFGELILKGKFELQLHQFAEEAFVPAGRSKSSLAEQGQSSGDSYQDIFEALRKLRKQLAEEHNLPPYIIFHDTSLKAMAEQLPQTEQDMLNISGVSFSKMQEYGHRVSGNYATVFSAHHIVC
jgi:ATP-dependent DNA helicase RecQ